MNRTLRGPAVPFKGSAENPTEHLSQGQPGRGRPDLNGAIPIGKPGNTSEAVPAWDLADHPRAWPSPSQHAAAGPSIRYGLKAGQRLASEVEVIWLDPAARRLPWLREGFWHRRPVGTAVKAYTVDGRGRVVRAFLARDCDLAAYAALLRVGAGTCPIEGIHPPSIAPGVPAEPAHPHLLRQRGEVAR